MQVRGGVTQTGERAARHIEEKQAQGSAWPKAEIAGDRRAKGQGADGVHPGVRPASVHEQGREQRRETSMVELGRPEGEGRHGHI